MPDKIQMATAEIAKAIGVLRADLPKLKEILTRHFGPPKPAQTAPAGPQSKIISLSKCCGAPVVLKRKRKGRDVYTVCGACGKIFTSDDPPEGLCPHCGSSKGTWFDRSLYVNSKGEETMANRCEDCGKDVDDPPDPPAPQTSGGKR